MKIANYVNLSEVGWSQILVKAIERRISSKMTSIYIPYRPLKRRPQMALIIGYDI